MQHSALFREIQTEMRKAIAGQDAVIRELIIALLTGGHVLLEGVPGVAKTLMVRTIARVFAVPFTRVQFTPDLMPTDLLGLNMYSPETGAFTFRRGPVFTTFLLADEINRTPPKTQAALLEAMQERQVSIDGVTYPLAPGFTVFATQNPIEYEGTYPLPEAQLDRFLMKIVVPYPEEATEVEMLRRHVEGFDPNALETSALRAIGSEETYVALRTQGAQVRVKPELQQYLGQLLKQSRVHELVLLGASPRAGVALLQAARTVAALEDRDYLVPDDVKDVLVPVWRHRLLLKPEAEIEGVTPDQILRDIAERVAVPR